MTSMTYDRLVALLDAASIEARGRGVTVSGTAVEAPRIFRVRWESLAYLAEIVVWNDTRHVDVSVANIGTGEFLDRSSTLDECAPAIVLALGHFDVAWSTGD